MYQDYNDVTLLKQTWPTERMGKQQSMCIHVGESIHTAIAKPGSKTFFRALKNLQSYHPEKAEINVILVSCNMTF